MSGMRTLSLWLAMVLVLPTVVLAQEDTAGHRAVYKEINDKQKTYRKVLATYEDSPLIFSLTGYLDGGEVRKIVAVSSEDGGGYEEFYLEGGKPLFVFSTYSQNHLSDYPIKVEDRRYFRDGRVFKWVTTDKSAGPASAKDNAESTRRLNELSRAFVTALKAAAGPSNAVEGTFTGIEEGDYAHWKMRVGGEERSFFILRPEPSVEKVLAKPASYIGKQCRITVKKSKENIPEAGGKIDVEQVISVEWLKK
jgi:hypothetical protein